MSMDSLENPSTSSLKSNLALKGMRYLGTLSERSG